MNNIFFSAKSKRCKRRLISDYTANLYTPVNRHLRGQVYDPTCRPILKDLILAVAGLGTCLVDKGFVSSSTDRDLALGFSGRDEQTLFEITSSNAHDLSELGSSRGYPGQPEMIFLPNTHFLVKKIEQQKHVRVIQLTEVPPGNCPKVIY